MSTSASSQELAKQIEQVVREHIAISQAVAQAAIERVFAEARGESGRQPRQATPTTRRLRRRASDEVAALSEKLYAAVCELPGETMAVLARRVGVTSRELKVPVARLKTAGSVRTVGRRSQMRYFPLVGNAKAGKGVNP